MFVKLHRPLPMSSPASMVLAELTMQQNDKSINADSSHNLKVWKRYVDDCFTNLKTSQIEDFLAYINTINPNRRGNSSPKCGQLSLPLGVTANYVGH